MEDKGQVEGRNAVLELLESGKDINKIFVQAGEKHGSITKVLAKAKESRIVVVEMQKRKMDEMSETHNHQGVIAIVPPFEYAEVEDILGEAKTKGEAPFILILDGIEDVHNLGSIIRTAETAGVHGIIIPKRRAAAVNATAYKTSAGAVEHVKIARVNNINETIKNLKDEGLWICGTDMETDTLYYEQDYTMPIAIVIGSEGSGMSRLTREKCDFIVKIPMQGKINSLNASVSAGIVIYEAVRNRKLLQK
ncbi:MAG: 23S rRNA (guanosine(2251)-2'-O)-methyltransferase RlmB [Clostridia bacterium]|nr:23S rRNA (guanosine(2251)-2'-O)-methyltransferase RlmB [Clostridia bacterium]